MPHPEIATRYDIDPVMAAESRAQLLKWVENQGIEVAGMHVPYPGMGKLSRTQRGLEQQLLK